MNIEQTLIKLEPIKHRLNEHLLANANHFIKKMEEGDLFSEHDVRYMAEMLKIAEAKDD